MNTKVILTRAAAIAVAAVTPVVIGRFGGEIAGFLRADVLLGAGVVATLVALITKEYVRIPRPARRPVVLRTLGEVVPAVPATNVVALRTDDETRVAA
jgi:hypothetical protein